MPVLVNCPACGRDGTTAANESIRKMLHGKTQPVPPASVAAVLKAVQPNLESHLVEALKDAVVHRLASQRGVCSPASSRRPRNSPARPPLEAVQTPMLERLRAYEQRIAELEKELGEQTKENHELLKLKIDLLREQIEKERCQERSHSRINFNLIKGSSPLT